MKTWRRRILESAAARRGLPGGLIVPLVMLAGCLGTEPDPPRATSISIAPESVTLSAGFGETRQFVASIADQHGKAFEGTFTWWGSHPEFFTVDENGLLTTVANGSGAVRVTYENLSATASVTVNVESPPT